MSHSEFAGLEVVASYVKDHFQHATIRCSSCEILVSSTATHCDPCKAYQKVLNAMLSRHQKPSVSERSPSQPDSCVNIRFLNTPQRKERMKRLHKSVRSGQQKVNRLQQKLDAVVEKRAIQVDPDLHDDLSAIVKEKTLQIKHNYPPGSFQHVFWEQQKLAMEKSDSRSMRWEPAMIR